MTTFSALQHSARPGREVRDVMFAHKLHARTIGRMGKPEEIAAAALWLCSADVAFVVGHAMVIDGGPTVGI